MGCVMKPIGGITPTISVAARAQLEKSRTTIAPTGATHGHYSPAMLLMYGMPAARPTSLRTLLLRRGSTYGRSSFGAKNNIVVSRGHYHPQHEPLFYAVPKKATAHWSGDRKQSTLWQIDKPVKSDTGHSTQKPLECMRRPIENNSSPGQALYDPFVGSGTTIIAAEMTGRACIGIEIEPSYVDVCVLRWQAFAGVEATLDCVSQTFAEALPSA
jgi:DNA methylase